MPVPARETDKSQLSSGERREDWVGIESLEHSWGMVHKTEGTTDLAFVLESTERYSKKYRFIIRKGENVVMNHTGC